VHAHIHNRQESGEELEANLGLVREEVCWSSSDGRGLPLIHVFVYSFTGYMLGDRVDANKQIIRNHPIKTFCMNNMETNMHCRDSHTSNTYMCEDIYTVEVDSQVEIEELDDDDEDDHVPWHETMKKEEEEEEAEEDAGLQWHYDTKPEDHGEVEADEWRDEAAWHSELQEQEHAAWQPEEPPWQFPPEPPAGGFAASFAAAATAAAEPRAGDAYGSPAEDCSQKGTEITYTGGDSYSPNPHNPN